MSNAIWIIVFESLHVKLHRHTSISAEDMMGDNCDNFMYLHVARTDAKMYRGWCFWSCHLCC